MGLNHPSDSRILIVDDEQGNVDVLTRMLKAAGYRRVEGTTDSTQTVPLLHSFRPDLILLDLTMPVMDGFAVLEQLAPLIPSDGYLPILILTGESRFEARQRALSGGAKDFLLKPFDMTEVLLRIKNLLETRNLYLLLQEQNQNLEVRVAARTRELEEARVEVLQRLSDAAEYRDDDTGQHTKRVAAIAVAIGRSMGLDHHTLELLRWSSPLHDVGKIGIPDSVLLKPGRLTDPEMEVMKSHTTIGARILMGGQSPLVQMAETIALNHHERWNGSGYPRALAGETIPIEARLVAVADVFDALTHARPYRAAWSIEETRAEIARGSGRHFDPEITRAFLSLPINDRILSA